jgi:hypothetical protein
VDNGYLSRAYRKMSREDRRTFDRWIKANAIIGLIFVVGLFAMALVGYGSREPRGAPVAQRGEPSHVATSDRRATAPPRALLRDSYE